GGVAAGAPRGARADWPRAPGQATLPEPTRWSALALRGSLPGGEVHGQGPRCPAWPGTPERQPPYLPAQQGDALAPDGQAARCDSGLLGSRRHQEYGDLCPFGPGHEAAGSGQSPREVTDAGHRFMEEG